MRYCLALFLCLMALAPAQAKTAHGIAMHGTPKYGANFTHFDYVNPDAPKGGVLRLSMNGSFDSLNPFIVRGQTALGISTGYLSLVYESLMARSWDEPFSLYGLLAESVDVPDDRSAISFTINPKARWSDGKPVTAEDVLFSFVTLRDKGRPNHRTYYKKVAKAEKIGERRVTFTFKRNPDGSIDREMPLIMGLMPVLPKHDWEGRDFNQTSLRLPVGSGPYTISKLNTGRSISYARNPDYWGNAVPAQKGLYNFDEVRIDYYRDDSIALEAFKARQFDWRREMDPNKWAAAYDFPATQDGRVKLERLEHRRPEPAAGFIFNMRRYLFKDPALREALGYAFDFGWINKNLFHGQYKRTESFFPNSELAAPPLPEGREKEILEKYKTQLPKDIFTKPVRPPASDGSEAALRDNLLKASEMLRDAGYVLRNGRLFAPGGAAVSFEILLSDPAEEKVALSWARSLKRLGIEARAHTVDSAQYQARMAAFDFDMASGKWINTLSPGNEQIFFWSSAAADQKGSRNYPGVKDPVVDALANAIPATATRADLVATTRALDRVLMAGHYTVPFYYLGADNVAFWAAQLHHPATMPIYGTVLESWWGKTAW
ncbi:MAG: extracellular solute-binding protein [Alphaproteobacteria bacterium]|nr:extracellular solute-binding protein [Alphaproteobacteria bacterium]